MLAYTSGDLFESPSIPSPTPLSSSASVQELLEPESEVELARIHLPDQQVRRVIDPAALGQLQASIESDGLLHPLTVLPLPSGDVLLVAGYRRYLACRALGWSRIPVILRADLTPGANGTTRITMAENDCRADPCAYDYACYVHSLREIRRAAGREDRIEDVADDLRVVGVPYTSDGWISQMLQIGARIDADTLERAGVEVATLSGLSRTALHQIARVEDDAERAADLQAAVAAQRQGPSGPEEPAPVSARSPYQCIPHKSGIETLRLDPRRMTLADCDELEAKASEIRARVEQRMSA